MEGGVANQYRLATTSLAINEPGELDQWEGRGHSRVPRICGLGADMANEMVGPGLQLVGESAYGSFPTCCLYFCVMVPVDNGRLAVQTIQRLSISSEDERMWEIDGRVADNSIAKIFCPPSQYFDEIL